MKKVLFPILALVLALSLALPMAAIVGAAPDTITVVSDDSGATVITTVYNKAGGVQTTVVPATPLTPVRAQEPKPYPTGYVTEGAEVTNSVWDNGVNWFEDNASAADWIWETERAEGPASYDGADPLYDADASRYGRVVLFETTFDIPGNPISATLHIAADNGYEAWVNAGSHHMSPSVGGSGWETSALMESDLSTSGWQSYGTIVIPGGDLINGSNTLYVLAGNEYYWTDDSRPNSPIPPYRASPYRQQNPGAAIFQLDVEYEEVSIEVEKDYRYTSVAFERDNDRDGLFNEDPEEVEVDNDLDGRFSEDPIDGIDNDGDGLTDEDPSEQIDNDLDGSFSEDPVDFPLGTDLGNPLPTVAADTYQLEAVIHPKNSKVRSYNPGQYYAVSTVTVLSDVETLTIFEDWSDCAGISVLNPKKGGGRVVIVQVGGEINGVPVPDPLAAYQILDADSDEVTVVGTTATAVLEDVKAGTTILMYVKFGPGLKGETWAGPYGPCENFNGASVVADPTYPEDFIVASANLIVVAQD